MSRNSATPSCISSANQARQRPNLGTPPFPTVSLFKMSSPYCEACRLTTTKSCLSHLFQVFTGDVHMCEKQDLMMVRPHTFLAQAFTKHGKLPAVSEYWSENRDRKLFSLVLSLSLFLF